MSEEENVQELIQTPHGVQESIKMDLLEMTQGKYLVKDLMTLIMILQLLTLNI